MIVYLLLSVFVSCGWATANPESTFFYEGSSAGSISRLYCNYPYTIVGSPTYYCGKNGEWQGEGRCRKFVPLFIFFHLEWCRSIVGLSICL